MIKRLRIKFICVVMTIVMLFLGISMGVVIHFAAQGMERTSLTQMRMMTNRMPRRENLRKESEEVRLPYFVVEVNQKGMLIRTEGDYFDLTDQENVLEIVQTTLASEEWTGKLETYRLRYLKESTPAGWRIIYSDTTAERAMLRSLVSSCVMIFAGASVIFFIITVALSQWVIRPVERAWNQQRQFVADASHELKTPLTVIMANAELLQEDEQVEEEHRRLSSNILSMSYQMRALVETMLEMARVDNGPEKMHKTEVDFSQMVQDAVLSMQLLYEERGLNLSCQGEEGICLQGSEQHLYQVLDVLLDNGLKYANPESAVAVQLKRSGRNCLLSVASYGATISQEDLKNIFKRFYRADKARPVNGSYGLGLAIAETIVTAHRGKIWAKSEDGCNTFFVQLPISN